MYVALSVNILIPTNVKPRQFFPLAFFPFFTLTRGATRHGDRPTNASAQHRPHIEANDGGPTTRERSPRRRRRLDDPGGRSPPPAELDGEGRAGDNRPDRAALRLGRAGEGSEADQVGVHVRRRLRGVLDAGGGLRRHREAGDPRRHEGVREHGVRLWSDRVSFEL